MLVNPETQENPYKQEVKGERNEPRISERRADYAFLSRAGAFELENLLTKWL
jgi:hypothetical protein